MASGSLSQREILCMLIHILSKDLFFCRPCLGKESNESLNRSPSPLPPRVKHILTKSNSQVTPGTNAIKLCFSSCKYLQERGCCLLIIEMGDFCPFNLMHWEHRYPRGQIPYVVGERWHFCRQSQWNRVTKLQYLCKLTFNLGSMLWSQFSASFANFDEKIGVFLKNQCYDHCFSKFSFVLSQKRRYFR
jgi:hypothetical protein